MYSFNFKKSFFSNKKKWKREKTQKHNSITAFYKGKLQITFHPFICVIQKFERREYVPFKCVTTVSNVHRSFMLHKINRIHYIVFRICSSMMVISMKICNKKLCLIHLNHKVLRKFILLYKLILSTSRAGVCDCTR